MTTEQAQARQEHEEQMLEDLLISAQEPQGNEEDIIASFEIEAIEWSFDEALYDPYEDQEPEEWLDFLIEENVGHDNWFHHLQQQLDEAPEIESYGYMEK